MKASATRVLLVEDDLDVAAGLVDFLSMNGLVMDFAPTVRQALSLVAESQFDLIILDLQLPDGDGLSLCETFRASGVCAPVIFLTARDALEDKLRAFGAGAVDYMVKPFWPEELLARIKALLLSHSHGASGWLVRVGPYTLNAHSGAFSGPHGTVSLGRTPTAILRRLMEASPGWISREALNEMIWRGNVPASNPLRMHIHELRRLLTAASSGDHLIKTVRGTGYRFEAGDGIH